MFSLGSQAKVATRFAVALILCLAGVISDSSKHLAFAKSDCCPQEDTGCGGLPPCTVGGQSTVFVKAINDRNVKGIGTLSGFQLKQVPDKFVRILKDDSSQISVEFKFDGNKIKATIAEATGGERSAPETNPRVLYIRENKQAKTLEVFVPNKENSREFDLDEIAQENRSYIIRRGNSANDKTGGVFSAEAIAMQK
jgi:hypothetical protein